MTSRRRKGVFFFTSNKHSIFRQFLRHVLASSLIFTMDQLRDVLGDVQFTNKDRVIEILYDEEVSKVQTHCW